MSSHCTVSCTGFQALRQECIDNPCMGDTLCHAYLGSGVVSSCAEWCCESRAGSVFAMVMLLCGALFLLSTAYYLYRLHQLNVESGAEAPPDATTGKPKAGAKQSKAPRSREMDQVAY
jgi:hypothetical protein